MTIKQGAGHVSCPAPCFLRSLPDFASLKNRPDRRPNLCRSFSNSACGSRKNGRSCSEKVPVYSTSILFLRRMLPAVRFSVPTGRFGCGVFGRARRRPRIYAGFETRLPSIRSPTRRLTIRCSIPPATVRRRGRPYRRTGPGAFRLFDLPVSRRKRASIPGRIPSDGAGWNPEAKCCN